MFYHSHPKELRTLGEARQVRLFRVGRSQAVRIPPGFELPGGEATIRKVGDRLILEPVRHKSLLQVLAAMAPLASGDEFPDVDETLEPLDEAPFGLGRCLSGSTAADGKSLNQWVSDELRACVAGPG